MSPSSSLTTRRLAAAIPNAELIWIEDAGHWLIDEKPAEIGVFLRNRWRPVLKPGRFGFWRS